MSYLFHSCLTKGNLKTHRDSVHVANSSVESNVESSSKFIVLDGSVENLDADDELLTEGRNFDLEEEEKSIESPEE